MVGVNRGVARAFDSVDAWRGGEQCCKLSLGPLYSKVPAQELALTLVDAWKSCKRIKSLVPSCSAMVWCLLCVASSIFKAARGRVWALEPGWSLPSKFNVVIKYLSFMLDGLVMLGRFSQRTPTMTSVRTIFDEWQQVSVLS